VNKGKGLRREADPSLEDLTTAEHDYMYRYYLPLRPGICADVCPNRQLTCLNPLILGGEEGVIGRKRALIPASNYLQRSPRVHS
jgi:hypothetical protein